MSQTGQVQTWTNTACTMQIQHYHGRKEQQTSSEGREASQAQPDSYPTHNFQLWREGKGRAFTSFSIYLQMRLSHIRRIHQILGVSKLLILTRPSPSISCGEAKHSPFPLSAGPISLVVLGKG